MTRTEDVSPFLKMGISQLAMLVYWSVVSLASREKTKTRSFSEPEFVGLFLVTCEIKK